MKFFILLIVSHLGVIKSQTLIRNYVEKHKFLVDCAVSVSTNHFDPRRQTLVLDRQADSSLTNRFLKSYQGVVVLDIIAYQPLSKQMVFILTNLIEFVKLMKELQPNLKGKRLLDHSAKIIIIYLSRSKNLQRIIDIMWKLYITNIVIITEIDEQYVGMYSYFPYTWAICGDTTPKLMHRWDRSDPKPYLDQVYPDKMGNFFGCPLYISTTKLYHPLVGPKIDIEVVKNRIIELLEENMRFTPHYIVSEYVNIGSERSNNWSSSLEDVTSGAVNISTIAVPLGSETQDLLDYTQPYYRAELVWIGPPVSVKPGSWRLLSPMSWHLWLALFPIVSFVFSLPILIKVPPIRKFSLQCFRKIHKLKSVMFRSWAVMFGQPISIFPQKFRDYYIVSLWLWFTFFVRSAYQSTLIVALKTDASLGNFNSLEDAIAAGYEFGGMSSALEHFSSEPTIINAFTKIPVDNFDTLFEEIQKGEKKFLLLTRREYVWARCAATDNFLTTTTGTLCVYVVPQPVLSLPLVIWLNHGSPLKRTLNAKIVRLQEAGLVISAPKPAPSILLNLDTNHTPLTMRQLIGCFVCLGIGSLISLIGFILELTTNTIISMDI